ncbi:MAG: pseudouridine synthase [Myxococcota bacterium]
MNRGMPFVNVAIYRFVDLDRLEKRRAELRSFCKKHRLKGTILLSPEGLNAFVAGRGPDIDALLDYLRRDLGVELDVKLSESDRQPFSRMLVKVKREIIAFGRPVATGEAPRLSPQTLKSWLDAGSPVTLVDTRNRFEIDVGTFAGAVDPGIDNFRDFPNALESLRKRVGPGPIVTFCTGGIRCEKAAPYMLDHGFEEVYQLDGGILRYFEECGDAHYDGECFVFDQRVAVNAALKETATTQCYACQHPLKPDDQRSPLYVEGKHCSYCYEDDASARAKRVAARNAALAERLRILPGSTPEENERPLYVSAAFDRHTLGHMLTDLHPHVENWHERVRDGRLRRRGTALEWQSEVRSGDVIIHVEPSTVEPDVSSDVRVLYEDDCIVAVHKPAPLPLHPSGRFNRNTLERFLRPIFEPKRLRPAHRLDGNTTGVVLFSKSRRIASLLQPQFEARTVDKRYVLEVDGHPAAARLRCEAPIGRTTGPAGRRHLDARGDEAVTEFLLIEERTNTSLLEARPSTGRTNQIRVHAMSLNLPIVGDRPYRDPNAPMTRGIHEPHMHLHAWKLTFDHPASDERLTIEAPAPDWARTLQPRAPAPTSHPGQ